MFIFVFFLMLFCAICFLLGGHMEKACESVRDETLYSDVRDHFCLCLAPILEINCMVSLRLTV